MQQVDVSYLIINTLVVRLFLFQQHKKRLYNNTVLVQNFQPCEIVLVLFISLFLSLRHFSQLNIMFVGGPNIRKDYHIEEGEEVRQTSLQSLYRNTPLNKDPSLNRGQSMYGDPSMNRGHAFIQQ